MAEALRMAKAGSGEEKGDMTNSMDGLEENQELLASVSTRMEEAFGVKPDDAVEVTETPAEETPAEETPVAKETPVVKETPAEEPAAEEPAAEEDMVPTNYVRAAIRQGWTEEQVRELIESNQEAGMRTLENIYNSTKNLNDKFAQIGRQVLEQKAPPANQPAPVNAPVNAEQKPFVDFDKLHEQYGEDPLIQNIIKPMSDALEELRTKQAPVVAPSPNPYQPSQQDMDALGKTIDDFFGTETLKRTYGKFYGSSNLPGELTLDQTDRRRSVLAKADQIIAGAEAQGIDMPIPEALENAHLLISEPVKRAAIRDEIKGTAVKRSKGISLRPSKATSPAQKLDNKPRTEEELEAKVQQGLNEIFKK